MGPGPNEGAPCLGAGAWRLESGRARWESDVLSVSVDVRRVGRGLHEMSFRQQRLADYYNALGATVFAIVGPKGGVCEPPFDAEQGDGALLAEQRQEERAQAQRVERAGAARVGSTAQRVTQQREQEEGGAQQLRAARAHARHGLGVYGVRREQQGRAGRHGNASLIVG